MENIASKTLMFLVYYFCSGFMGKILYFMFLPILNLMFKSKENYTNFANLVLYLIGAGAIILILAIFAFKNGSEDEKSHKFNAFSAFVGYFCAGFLFYGVIITLGILEKMLVKTEILINLREYIFEIYTSSALKAFLEDKFILSSEAEFILSDYLFSGVYILLSGLIMQIFYRLGGMFSAISKKKKPRDIKI